MGALVVGRVFSGIGKGRYYVGHPEYQKRFKEALGYRPYPGTLNVKLESPESSRALNEARGGVVIRPFTFEGESFSGLECFEGSLLGERAAFLRIEITHYNATVAELVSPVYLRGKLGVKDGDLVEFAMDGAGLTGEGRRRAPGRRPSSRGSS
ncbi:MAG: CTP-dependent riboflavin kinase [archaeon]|nr:MAG: CTP-dependent riboflavin kinase [archaeon]